MGSTNSKQTRPPLETDHFLLTDGYIPPNHPSVDEYQHSAEAHNYTNSVPVQSLTSLPVYNTGVVDSFHHGVTTTLQDSVNFPFAGSTLPAALPRFADPNSSYRQQTLFAASESCLPKSNSAPDFTSLTSPGLQYSNYTHVTSHPSQLTTSTNHEYSLSAAQFGVPATFGDHRPAPTPLIRHNYSQSLQAPHSQLALHPNIPHGSSPLDAIPRSLLTQVDNLGNPVNMSTHTPLRTDVIENTASPPLEWRQVETTNRVTADYFDASTGLPVREQMVCPDIFAKIDKGLFMAKDANGKEEWACYRRNYFSVNYAYDIPDMPSHGSLYIDMPDSKERRQVKAIGMKLVAAVDGLNGKHIEVIVYTPKRDQGEKFKLWTMRMCPITRPNTVMEKHRYQTKQTAFGDVILCPPRWLEFQTQPNTDQSEEYRKAVQHKFLDTVSAIPEGRDQECELNRLQFKQATANNGRRRASQQYFHIVLELWADVRNNVNDAPVWVKMCHKVSDKIVVRGRSPSHYNDSGSNAALRAQGINRSGTHHDHAQAPFEYSPYHGKYMIGTSYYENTISVCSGPQPARDHHRSEGNGMGYVLQHSRTFHHEDDHRDSVMSDSDHESQKEAMRPLPRDFYSYSPQTGLSQHNTQSAFHPLPPPPGQSLLQHHTSLPPPPMLLQKLDAPVQSLTDPHGSFQSPATWPLTHSFHHPVSHPAEHPLNGYHSASSESDAHPQTFNHHHHSSGEHTPHSQGY